MRYSAEQKKVDKYIISCQTIEDKRKRREGGNLCQGVAVFTKK